MIDFIPIKFEPNARRKHSKKPVMILCEDDTWYRILTEGMSIQAVKKDVLEPLTPNCVQRNLLIRVEGDGMWQTHAGGDGVYQVKLEYNPDLDCIYQVADSYGELFEVARYVLNKAIEEFEPNVPPTVRATLVKRALTDLSAVAGEIQRDQA